MFIHHCIKRVQILVPYPLSPVAWERQIFLTSRFTLVLSIVTVLIDQAVCVLLCKAKPVISKFLKFETENQYSNWDSIFFSLFNLQNLNCTHLVTTCPLCFNFSHLCKELYIQWNPHLRFVWGAVDLNTIQRILSGGH
jgi:hypothetical protein